MQFHSTLKDKTMTSASLKLRLEFAEYRNSIKFNYMKVYLINFYNS